jgi:hypothetical protein
MELNRDRDMVDADTLFERIKQVWNGSEITDRQMQAYWTNVAWASKLEYRDVMHLTGDNAVRMLRAFKKVFGRKACIMTNSSAAMDAEALGFNVVNIPNFAKETALAVGARTDVNAAGFMGQRKLLTKIPAWVNECLGLLNDISESLNLTQFEVVPVERMLDISDEHLGGLWDLQERKIYILMSQFERGAGDLVRAYLHETNHGMSGASDYSREFASWYENLLVRVLAGELPVVGASIRKLSKVIHNRPVKA